MVLFIKRYTWLVGLFCLSFALGLVVYLPLGVIIHQLQKNTSALTVNATRGSWWRGQLLDVSWQQLNHANVSWDLSLKALLSGEISVDLGLIHPTVQASTALSLPINGLFSPSPVQLNDAKVQVAIGQLTPFAPYPLPKISGQLTVEVKQLTLDMQALSNITTLPLIALDSPIEFSTSQVTVLNNLAIGRYSGQIINTLSTPGYKITVQSMDEVLAVSGHSVLSAHQIKSHYLVQPNQNTPSQLTKLLDIMGQKLQNGDYRFNTAYAL
jgi:hypothetical protein|tara:strand:+ start:10453 stop:11256 length:804 start_codon:yes stop_codon:yes gene_type:complete